MYEDVLVATDGSDVATTAAAQGIAIADAVGATVHVVSVVAARSDTDRSRHEAFVESVANDAADAGCSVETAVREGRPSREILAHADEEAVDLLVMGTHGRTGIRQTLLGSVALEVIRQARLPVLTVSADASDVPREVDDVLVATDGWSGSVAATEQALALADAFDARLHALYAVDVSPELDDVLESFEEHGKQTTMDVVDRARERGIEATRTVERGEPHETILAYADEEDVDLLVLGTESKSTIERLVIGSVSQRVVPNATTPVLTVRTLEE